MSEWDNHQESKEQKIKRKIRNVEKIRVDEDDEFMYKEWKIL